MQLVEIELTRSPMMKLHKIVGAHEVPVMQALHGKGNVTVLKEAGEAASPDPQEEYGRLIRAYGADRKTGIPFAERVYGIDGVNLPGALAAERRTRKAA